MDANRSAADKKLKFILILGFVILIMQLACGAILPQETIPTLTQFSTHTLPSTYTSVYTPTSTSTPISSETTSSGKIAYSVLEPPAVEGPHTWMVSASSSNLANRWYWKIWMMDADGSNQVRVASSEEDYFWSRDGNFLFYSVGHSTMQVYEADTGLVQEFTSYGDQPWLLSIPDSISKPPAFWSPDGKVIWLRGGSDHYEIWVIDADNDTSVHLTNSETRVYLPQWSPDGSRIAYQTHTDDFVDVWVMDADGSNLLKLSDFPDVSHYIAQSYSWSPDSTKIAFVFSSYLDTSLHGIWVANADGSSTVQLTYGNGNIPVWSPDGSKIAFNSSQSGSWAIWIMDADGSNQAQLTDDSLKASLGSWSPDGNQIVFSSGSNHQIFRINVDGSDLVQLTDHEGGATNPIWQPAPQD